MKFKEKLNNSKYKQISFYTIVTCIVIYILYRLTDYIGLGLAALGRGIGFLVVILKPVFWGLVLAYLFRPLVRFFQNKLMKTEHFENRPKPARNWSVLISMLLVLAIIVLVCSLLVSSVTKEMKIANFDSTMNVIHSTMTGFNSFYQSAIDKLNSMNIDSSSISNAVDKVTKAIGNYFNQQASNMAQSASSIGSTLSTVFFSIVFCIYFLLDGTMLRKYWGRVSRAIFGKKTLGVFRTLLSDTDRVFSGYIRGQLLDACIMAILVSIALSLVGVKFSIIIGVLTGLGNLIPYVGPFVAYASTIIVCLIQGDFTRLIIAVICIGAIQAIDGNVINPKLLSTNINIHPLLVIISLIVGEAVAGIIGMLFAVPIAGLLKVWFERGLNALFEKRGMKDEIDDPIENIVIGESVESQTPDYDDITDWSSGKYSDEEGSGDHEGNAAEDAPHDNGEKAPDVSKDDRNADLKDEERGE